MNVSVIFERRFRISVLSAWLLCVAACGSGGSSPSATPPTGNPPPLPPPPPPTQGDASYVELSSDAGDYIGGGKHYLHTTADSEISVASDKAYLRVDVDAGATWWTGKFRLPENLWKLEPGTYDNLTRYPFHDIGVGGMDWSGSGRGCNQLTGTLTIDRVRYDGPRITGFDLEFEQHCESSVAALHGTIHWNANDDPNPPPVQDPPPQAIPPGEPPNTGSSYVRLTSDLGDWVGDSLDYDFTNANSEITVSANGAFFEVTVLGDDYWDGMFQLPDTYTRIEPGSFLDIERYPFHVASAGGLDWSGAGRGCITLNGWLIIDQVTYDGPDLSSIDFRFEQHCEGAEPALHGEIHWDANDTTSAPGRLVPPPDFLWKSPPDVTPATGNYVYLESDQYEFVGAGETYLYTDQNSVIDAEATGPQISVSVFGDESWNGTFQSMNSMNRIEAGYYTYAQRYPFGNPTQGSLSWFGDNRGCNRLIGWFVVDDVSYDGDTLTSLDARFEQHCELWAPALHGEIHWKADNSTQPAGPIVPPPTGLWEPVPGATPSSGNFVFLESEPGDYVGQGGTYLYTQADSVITLEPISEGLDVAVVGDERWHGDFQGMIGLSQLEPGYYGDLSRYPFHNPTVGGLDWDGESRGCNNVSGWFVVDSVTYDGAALAAIDLRFEQHCEEGVPALHGEIHWDANDPTRPPGPLVPPPAGLWEPPPGTTPASGDYVYLESDSDDIVGAGGSYLYAPGNSQLAVNWNGSELSIAVNRKEYWQGRFQPMDSLDRIEVGYYGDLQGIPFNNPARGGLSWTGENANCNTLTGWFVADSVTYDGPALDAIDLRFEQHCDGGDAALNGEIHWSR